MLAPDPYTDPDFAAAALITIDTQCDVLDSGPLEIPASCPQARPISQTMRAL